MKKRLLSLLLSLIMVLSLVPTMAFAATTVDSGKCGDNLTWTLDSDGVLTISGTGEMTAHPWNDDTITSVIIENGVTTIGYGAFEDCRSLTSVTIPNGVTSIGDYAFSDCRSLTSVTIPDSVTTIGEWAFYCCSSLTGVTIPNSVTSIGGGAFSGCTGLTGVTIPDSVTTIGYGAFEDCSNLTSVTIPDSVTTIGGGAFEDCSSLTSVTIPDSVTTIGYGAFCDCSSLTSVTIPNSVTSIGDRAFAGTPWFETLYNEAGDFVIVDNILFKYRGSASDVIIPEDIVIIGGGAFSGCSSLTSVTIPDSVTSIGDEAFCGCTGLTSVTIPNSVTSIGDEAFLGCGSLTSVTIGNSVTTIGDWAFDSCSSLTSVTIPDSVTTIGDSAFRGCTGLTSVTIPDSVTDISWSVFEDCSSLTSVTIPDSVTTIGGGAFSGCTGLTSVTIPDSVTTIGDEAFLGCGSLTSVTIPDSVTTIGGRAFYNCKALEDVYYLGTAAQWKKIKIKYDNQPLTDATRHYTGNYTVKFNANGGSGTMDAGKYTGSTTLPKNTFKHTGYTFTGWNTKKDGTGTKYSADKEISGFTGTLYAQWKANSYTVKFNANGGSGKMSSQSFTYDTAKKLTANKFTKSGLSFAGWNTKADGSGKSYQNSASVKNLTAKSGGTVTLYAQWKKGYKVAFNANGGSGSMSKQQFIVGKAQKLTANTLTRKGWHFTGWNTKKDGSGKSYADEASVKNLATTNGKTITLYAQWARNKYYVKFDANGGTGTMKKLTCQYGVAKKAPACAFTRKGYAFTGWNTKKDGSGTNYENKYSFKTLTSTNGKTVTLYAQWRKK